MKKLISVMTATLVAMVFSGCENDSSGGLEDISDAVTLAEDEVFTLKSAEATDCDVNAARFGGHLFKGNMMVGGPHLFFGKNFPDCAEVSITTEENGDFPKEIKINYGEGCLGKAGLEKRGIITIIMSDAIINPGAKYTITFDGMTIGNREVEKTAAIINEGQNENGNWVISSQHTMTSTMESEGTSMVMVREFTEQKEWINGFDTPETEDDQFFKTGGGTMTLNNDLKFDRNITSALFIDRTCMFPLSGIIEITREGEMMTIDFGDGDCDNIALVTKDGEDEEIELVSGKFRKGFKRHNRNMKLKKGWW